MPSFAQAPHYTEFFATVLGVKAGTFAQLNMEDASQEYDRLKRLWRPEESYEDLERVMMHKQQDLSVRTSQLEQQVSTLNNLLQDNTLRAFGSMWHFQQTLLDFVEKFQKS